MNIRKARTVALLALVVVLLVVSGCIGQGRRVRIGALQTESRSIELGGADSVRVEIEMGAGELDVAGGAGELLQADFAYNVAEFKPQVTYDDGLLVIRQPEVEGRASVWDVDEYRYEWNLRLNADVLMEMSVSLGAGRTDLDLGSLSLTGLDIDAGAGEITADLSGASSLTRLGVKMGVGGLDLDLTGDWQQDLDAKIEGGVGEATLRLPRTAGVRVEVQGGLGTVNASGLTKDGSTYVNDAYGQSDVTLRIEVEAGVGTIHLELGE
jgi:hypothetical protein